jgi:outer membrane protein TolC
MVTDVASRVTLDDLVEAVVARAPLLEAAARERSQAEAERLAAEGAFDPSLRLRGASDLTGAYENRRADVILEQPLAPLGANLFGGYRLGAGEFAAYDGKLVTNDLGEVRAGAAWSLGRNRAIDRRRSNLQKAQAGAEAARAGFEQATLDTLRAAVGRYWDWVGAGRRVAIAEALLAIARTRDEAIARRVEAGEIPAIDRADNARSVEQRRQGLQSAQRARDLAALELSLQLRDDEGRPLVLPGSRLPELPTPLTPPASDFASDLAAALAQRPDLARLRSQRAQAAAETAFAENQRAWALDLSVAASKDLGDPTDGNLKRGSPVLEAGVLLDVPLQRRLLEGRAKSAEAAEARLAIQERYAADRIRTDLLDAQSAIDAAHARLIAARAELALAREVEEGERRKYDAGESTLLFVNLREQQTAETAVREVEAAVDLLKGLAQRQLARGELPRSGA